VRCNGAVAPQLNVSLRIYYERRVNVCNPPAFCELARLVQNQVPSLVTPLRNEGGENARILRWGHSRTALKPCKLQHLTRPQVHHDYGDVSSPFHSILYQGTYCGTAWTPRCHKPDDHEPSSELRKPERFTVDGYEGSIWCLHPLKWADFRALRSWDGIDGLRLSSDHSWDGSGRSALRACAQEAH